MNTSIKEIGKPCRSCGLYKPFKMFAKLSRNSNLTRRCCRACESEKFKRWYKKNRSSEIEKSTAWNNDPRNRQRRVANIKKNLEKRKLQRKQAREAKKTNGD